MTADSAYYLSIYIHAHKTGNSVPPHIEAEAIAALSAKPETTETASEEAVLARVKFADREFNTPSDVVLRQFCDDWFYADPNRKEIDPADLCRAAIKLFAHIPAPISLKERLPKPEDCNERGECWHWQQGPESWELISPPENYYVFDEWTHFLPHWALPIPLQNP
jgi:hypothetical protein